MNCARRSEAGTAESDDDEFVNLYIERINRTKLALLVASLPYGAGEWTEILVEEMITGCRESVKFRAPPDGRGSIVIMQSSDVCNQYSVLRLCGFNTTLVPKLVSFKN